MKHNTKPHDPSAPTKKRGGYKTWSDESKLVHRARVYRKALLRKDKLLEIHGGKCIKCGYDKCTRALTFHHKDKSTKLFGLSLNNLWSKSWSLIEEESNKCELLCMNCHAEHEQIESEDKGIYRRIIEERWSDKDPFDGAAG
jgi:hypothetical protein